MSEHTPVEKERAAYLTCVPCGEPMDGPEDGRCPLCGVEIAVCRSCADDHQNLTCCQASRTQLSEGEQSVESAWDFTLRVEKQFKSSLMAFESQIFAEELEERDKALLSQHSARLREENRRLREVLEAIANPIEHLLNQLPAGQVFDGEAACRITDNPHWARDIARAALTKEGGEG